MAELEFAVVPEENTCKLVTDVAIARKLLKDGYHIVDIKPKRGHERETVFIFEVVPGFMEKMGEYIQMRKERRTTKEEG